MKRLGIIIVALVLALLARPADAAVAFDAISQVAYGDGGELSSFTWNHTVTGSNTYLFVMVYMSENNQNTGTATFNGVSMTKLGFLDVHAFFGGGNDSVTMFGLKSPASGTHAIVVGTGGSGTYWAGTGSSYTGIDQTTPVGSLVSAANTGTVSTVTAVSASGEVVVDFSMLENQSLAGLADVSQTVRTTSYSNFESLSTSDKPGATSTVMTWTHASHAWALMAVPLKPVATATATPTPSPTPAATNTPTATPTVTPTVTATATITPTVPPAVVTPTSRRRHIH